MSDPLKKPDPTDGVVGTVDAEGVPPAAETPQPAAASGETAAEPATTRVLTLEQEVSTLKDQLLRALAEVENIRRRAQREREDQSKYAISNFAKDLLPVADNLRRALDAAPPEAREGSEILKTLAVGVEATERQLVAAFDRVGIRKLEPLGDNFDPNFHQVMFEVENTGRPAGTVVQVLQAGYTIHGRLLREAMVGVAKRGAEDATQSHLDTRA
jgi:molecular chaperone GrpE